MRDHYFKNYSLVAVRGIVAALLAVCFGLMSSAAFAQTVAAVNGTPPAADANCTVTAMNRTAPLQADYSFTIYNIPGASAVVGPAALLPPPPSAPFRVRAVCSTHEPSIDLSEREV